MRETETAYFSMSCAMFAGNSAGAFGGGICNGDQERTVFIQSSHFTCNVDSESEPTRNPHVYGAAQLDSSCSFSNVCPAAVHTCVPDTGTSGGGTNITLKADGLPFDATFWIGGQLCLRQQTVSDKLGWCITPPGHGRWRTIKVTASGVLPSISSEAFFHYASPQLFRIDPDHGTTTGGTRVTITGFSLTSTTRATFGQRDSPCAVYEKLGDTLAVCVTPEGSGQNHTICVINADETVCLRRAFHFDAPIAAAVTANSGPVTGGMRVTIYGHNFGEKGASVSVTVGGLNCDGVVW